MLTYRFYQLPMLLGKKPIADVYLSLNDPHSFMLAQVLPEIEKRFHITFNLYLVADTTSGEEVDVSLLRQWALKDANYIAEKYGLTQVDTFPHVKTLVTGQQSWILKVKNVQDALTIFNRTWFDEFDEHFPLSTPVINAQINNQRRLFRRGYHASASLFFCGEWFVGVDRLEHLERLLNAKGLSRDKATVVYDKNSLQLIENTESISNKSPIEAFVSLNSPFAYLGLIQAKKISEQYQVPLAIKPLIPINMQGVTIHEHKERYMLLDAVREAKKLNIELNGYAKPLDQGVINIYQLFLFAEKENKAYEFLEAAFEAIYVKEIDLSIEKHIHAVCQQASISYDEAIAYANENDWQQWSDNNHLALNNMGLWGVPCFRYEDVSCWGQDRLVQIEDAILTP